MDRFIIKGQKNDTIFTKFGRAVCVLGPTGIGKSWLVHKHMDPCIEITSDTLRSKQDTINLLEKIRGTDIPVIIDEYEAVSDLAGIRELSGPPTNGILIIISQVPLRLDFDIPVWQFPIKNEEEIMALFPGADPEVVRESKGDLRRVKQSLIFQSDDWDEFQSPKEFIKSLVSVGYDEPPSLYIGHIMPEPGNIVSILQENYVNNAKADLDLLVRISDSFSSADIFDRKMYEGSWDLMVYHTMFGCVIPAIELNHSLGPDLRPGSLWTKYQNTCMRIKRLRTLSRRPKNGQSLSRSALSMLRTYIQEGNFEIISEYDIQVQDVDTFNYLSPLAKIKPKVLSSLKKWLQERSSKSLT